MSRLQPASDVKPDQSSDTKERLTSTAVGSRDDRDKIDPLVEQWLQGLVKVALAIAARNSDHKGGADGSKNET